MAYTKIYSRVNWKNESESKSTPLGATLLNRMDNALDRLDDRAIELDTIKLDKITANNLVKDWSVNEKTGVITVTKLDGGKIIFDLNIEKVPVNFELTENGILKMITDDGIEFTADIGSMIPIMEFKESDTISVTKTDKGQEKEYTFAIKDGSVTPQKLRPDYLADITTQANKSGENARLAEQNAQESRQNANEADESARQAEASKEEAKQIADEAEELVELAYEIIKNSGNGGINDLIEIEKELFKLERGVIAPIGNVKKVVHQEIDIYGDSFVVLHENVTLGNIASYCRDKQFWADITIDVNDSFVAEDIALKYDGNVYIGGQRNAMPTMLIVDIVTGRPMLFKEIQGTFMATKITCVADTAATGMIFAMDDGSIWEMTSRDGEPTMITKGIVGEIKDIVYAPDQGRYLAIYDDGSVFAFSEDGTIHYQGNPSMTAVSIAYGECFLAVSNAGDVSKSTNGEQWEIIGSIGAEVTSLKYVDGRFTALGKISGIYQSKDNGKTWIKKANEAYEHIIDTDYETQDMQYNNMGLILYDGEFVKASIDKINLSLTETVKELYLDMEARKGKVFFFRRTVTRNDKSTVVAAFKDERIIRGKVYYDFNVFPNIEGVFVQQGGNILAVNIPHGSVQDIDITIRVEVIDDDEVVEGM